MNLLIRVVAVIAAAVLGVVIDRALANTDFLKGSHQIVSIIVVIIILALIAVLPGYIPEAGSSVEEVPLLATESPDRVATVRTNPTSTFGVPTLAPTEETIENRAPFLESDPTNWLDFEQLNIPDNLELYDANYVDIQNLSQLDLDNPLAYSYELRDECKGTGELNVFYVSLLKLSTTKEAERVWQEHYYNVLEEEPYPSTAVKHVTVGNIGYEYNIFPLARMYCGEFLAAYSEITFQRYNAVVTVYAESRIEHTLEQIEASQGMQDENYAFALSMAQQIDAQLSGEASQ